MLCQLLLLLSLETCLNISTFGTHQCRQRWGYGGWGSSPWTFSLIKIECSDEEVRAGLWHSNDTVVSVGVWHVGALWYWLSLEEALRDLLGRQSTHAGCGWRLWKRVLLISLSILVDLLDSPRFLVGVCVSGVGGTGGRIGIQNRRQVHGLMGHLCFSLTTRQVGYTKRGIGGGTRTVDFPT